jgi:ABC-2 type transport system ATP-binding protein
MDTNDSLAIETSGLEKQYRGVTALASLDLRVPSASIFGFLGPNGAGKTTTMKLLLGLARPTAGSVRVFGVDAARDEVRHRIGYLPQNPRFYDHLCARENVRLRALQYYRGPRRAIDRRVEECLDAVGLADRADRPIRGFSGGERQRLGLAQAQVNRPDLLILDEPAANLDPLGRRDVLDLVERLRGITTVFYSTHILDDVQRVSDAVAILDRGRLAAQGPVGELLASRGGAPSWRVRVRGDAAGLAARLRAVPWVAGVRSSGSGAVASLEIAAADAAAAEAGLLDVVQRYPGVRVTEFARRESDLEEVFLGLVKGGIDA